MAMKRPEVFLDTSALFAACWASESSARLVLKLGEAGALDILVSPQVLSEAEHSLAEADAGALPLLALLLDASRARTVPPADAPAVLEMAKVVGHAGDAQVAADAEAAGTDYLVTLDRGYLLGNRNLFRRARYGVGSPMAFVTWFREQLVRREK